MIDKHKVEIFYTAPTALRALMRDGDAPVQATSAASPCGCWAASASRSIRKPGSGTTAWSARAAARSSTPGGRPRPAPPDLAAAGRDGAQARLGDQALARGEAADSSTPTAQVLEGATSGNLCIIDSWPGQMRTVYGDHDRFIATYFTTYPGKYFTGDGCRRDEDGYYWITGRVDDVINVSGHRLGTAEIESALVAHHAVAEAAVVGFPHDIKGQGIYAYVTLKADQTPSEALRAELVMGAHARSAPSPRRT